MALVTPVVRSRVPSLRDVALILVIGFLIVSNGLPRVVAFAQGTNDGRANTPLANSFTYQGRLHLNDIPADGQYDFQFVLFDQATGGLQVGTPSTVVRENVQVTNGLFSTELDFGATAFQGSERYLEVRVRPGASTGAYETLGQRQELTATPYALFAKGVDWSGISNIPPGIEDGDHIGETWTKTAPGAAAVLKAVNAADQGSCAGTCIGLHGDGGSSIYGVGVRGQGGNAGVYGTGTKYGLRGSATGVVDAAGVYGDGIIGVEGLAYPVPGSSPTSTTEIGVKGWVNGTTGCDAEGEGFCYGVQGIAPMLYQGRPFGGVGVYGEGGAAGVWGKGQQVGVDGEADVVGVQGKGDLYGVFGQGRTGIYGEGKNGLYGESNNPAPCDTPGEGHCYGVYGQSFATQGSGYGGVGVYGVGTNTGIWGRASGGYAGYFEGSVNVTGTVTQASDSRLKKNIQPLSYGLDEVLELAPKSYAFIEGDDSQRVGLIAQDVQALIPELVSTDIVGGYLGLDYTGLIPVLINAIQEQQVQIESQQAQIDALQAAILD